jgi:hypothetical protein
MASSTSIIQQISSSQASKEVTANGLFDAGSHALLYGRKAETTAALTWGYYGGNILLAGVVTAIVNGTVALTASTTNYVEASSSTGAVSVNTSGFTANAIPLYSIVTGTATITSYTDKRVYALATHRPVPVKAVTYAASVTLDCSLYSKFEATLTGNISVTMSNPVDGQEIEVALKQDGTGSRTLTWASTVGYGTDVTSGTATSAGTANKTDIYTLRYRASGTTWHMVRCVRGY